MGTYIVRRLVQAILVILIITFLVFIVIRLLPGDPILLYLSEQQTDTMSEEQLNKVRAEFGLDKPLPVQYLNWIKDLFRGDLGMSLFFHEHVGALIAQRFPLTLYLGLMAFFVSHILGFFLV